MMSRYILLCLVAVLPVMTVGRVKPSEVKDACGYSCMKDLYAEFCGGAKCVTGTETEEEKEALCSDKCLNILFGEAALLCMELNLPENAAVIDYNNFLKEEVYGRVHLPPRPPCLIVSLRFLLQWISSIPGGYLE